VKASSSFEGGAMIEGFGILNCFHQGCDIDCDCRSFQFSEVVLLEAEASVQPHMEGCSLFEHR
jgi:hypothetical protein